MAVVAPRPAANHAQQRVRDHIDALAKREVARKATASLARASDNSEARERNFQVHFSGANRQLAVQKNAFPARRQLRVPGAPPVLLQAQAQQQGKAALKPDALKRPSSQQAASAPIPLLAAAPPSRNRRRWAVGQPVMVLSADGDTLVYTPNWQHSHTPELAACAIEVEACSPVRIVENGASGAAADASSLPPAPNCKCAEPSPSAGARPASGLAAATCRGPLLLPRITSPRSGISPTLPPLAMPPCPPTPNAAPPAAASPAASPVPSPARSPSAHGDEPPCATSPVCTADVATRSESQASPVPGERGGAGESGPGGCRTDGTSMHDLDGDAFGKPWAQRQDR